MNIGKFIYFEFLFPIKDYFSTLTTKEFLFDISTPTVASTIFYVLSSNDIDSEKIGPLIGYIINLLAILIAFSITSLTIISSESGNKFDHLRQIKSDRFISDKNISLHQLILITFIFVIIIEFSTLIINLLFYFLWVNKCFLSHLKIIITINLFLLLNVIMLNIRNITNFYFVFWKR